VYERLGSAEKQIVIYPGFFHEVLNEVERARVVHDLLTWLGQRTASHRHAEDGVSFGLGDTPPLF
jgi:alpha-beta hydrolase superfamily lysophospholipase